MKIRHTVAALVGLSVLALTLLGYGLFANKHWETLPAVAPTNAFVQTTIPAGASPVNHPDAQNFTLHSSDVIEEGTLPADYTCDGASATLPLAWDGAPQGTQSFAVIMHHIAGPKDVHWYWVLYDIPANVTTLSKNSTGIGTLGTNSVNARTAYTPPCSKGPGPKVYTYTVYALSAQPQFHVPASQVNRAALLEAMQNITLARAELHVTYTRK